MWQDRPVGYDPDLVYSESDETWVMQSDQVPMAGEKFARLIAISEQGEIYAGEM